MNAGLAPDIGLTLPPEIAQPLQRTWSVEESFDYSTALTKTHYENFPVGSILAPKAVQPAIHSLYAFMRTADDFSDEDRKAGDEQQRLAYLNAWDQLLAECERGQARHPIFIALKVTLDHYQLPAQWLRDLLTAFKMDCTINRYTTYADLLNYCRFSANPVGRLILTLFGYRSEELYLLSDAICTALQLANHWQDVAVDLKKNRIYLPSEDMKTFGVTEDALFAGKTSPAFRDLLAFEVKEARALFVKGQALPRLVKGRLRVELAMTWRGGVSILDKIEAVHYDVFTQRPIVTKLDWMRIGMSSLVASL